MQAGIGLRGDAGRDVLQTGGSGNDMLTGGDGADRLSGGTGSDVMTGRAGSERVLYGSAGHSTDTAFDDLLDCNAAGPRSAGDLIGLSSMDADATTAANDAVTAAAQIRLSSGPPGTTLLLLNTDLDNAAEAVIAVTAGVPEMADVIL